jgi:hypothetical protein
MSYRRSVLSSFLIISAMSLTACSSTHIEDTSPLSGSPRIVASDVKVKVTPYADATKPEGGRVEEQPILGQVVMGRGDYSLLMAEIAGLSESIKKLKADNRILGAYAEQCARAAR